MPEYSRGSRRIALITTIAVLCLAAASVVADETGRNEQAIADVEAGNVKTARASWWGFHPEDATSSLQAALDSRAIRVVVERMNGPWIVTPIRLPSDKEIIFELGAVVEATRSLCPLDQSLHARRARGTGADEGALVHQRERRHGPAAV